MAPPGSDATGDGSSAPSRSAIIGTSVTGSHLIEIEGYSLIKEQLPTSTCVELRPFSVGGHCWQLKFYPNNEIGLYRDYICVSIQHLRQGSTAPSIRPTVGAVNARVTLSLLDQAGEPVVSRTRTTGLHDFSHTGVRVDDIEAQVFRALLGFVYTDTLEDGLGVKQQNEAAMAQHLLVAADRYNLHRLKLICEDKLCKHIDTGSAATILALAEQHSSGGLKKACLQFLSSPVNLNDVMATDGFEHLARSCPSVLKELISNVPNRVAARQGLSMGQREVLSSGRRTNYWYQVIVLILLCGVLYLKGGNAPLSCFCLVALFFVGIILQ